MPAIFNSRTTRGFNDERGNVFFEITHIIDTKRPKVVFLENVSNLLKHDNGKTFLVIYNSLAQFCYSIYYHIMAGIEYGNLLQIRKRIYIIVVSEKFCQGIYHHPEPIELTLKSLDIIHRDEHKNNICYYDDTEMYSYLEKNMNDKTTIYRITDHEVRLNKNGMCPTLTANMGIYPNRVPVIWDDFGIRKFTLRECLDFQGFQESLIFQTKLLSMMHINKSVILFVFL